MTFEEALREQCELGKLRRFRSKRILKVLNSKPSEKRTRILRRLEALVAANLNLEGVKLVRNDGGVGEIDWGAIDWTKLFDTILKFILALLPLFI